MLLNSVKIFLTVMATAICFHVHSQNPDWSKTRNWKLYKLESNQAFSCPPDSLKTLPAILLNNDSMIIFLKTASAWPKEKYSLWMGSWLASYEDETGILHKIDISMYGGFFYDEQLKTYYQVAAERKKEWTQFILDQYEKFYP